MKKNNAPKLTAIRHPVQQNKIITDPTECVEELEARFKALMQPRFRKTGQYILQGAQRDFPWEKGYNWNKKDRYKLSSEMTGKSMIEKESELRKYMTEDTFLRCINSLASNKAPGPDGIPNELLKYMPAEHKKMIFQYLLNIYDSASLPQKDNNSNTVLLYKKGDPMDPIKSYRPIGLANSLYKLYTRLLTTAFYRYAENNKMLHSLQGGFKKFTGTTENIIQYVAALEDSIIHDSDLYVLYIDLSSAFNTVDHDKLLQVMYEIGFPESAIKATRSLYTSATTTIITDVGNTKPVPVERGTIQGDSLSPFLFLLFIEPLFRWLHCGERGYKLKALPTTQRQELHMSGQGFADDTKIMTETVEDMEVQCKKLTEYLNWTGMEANHSKCAITGRVAGSSNHTQAAQIKHIKTKLGVIKQDTHKHPHGESQRIKIAGKPIPFLPPNLPYRYLGYDITLTLNWKFLLQRIYQEAKAKGELIVHSTASTLQKERMIKQIVIPMIAYHLPIAPYQMADLARLDVLLTSLMRKVWRLRNTYPTRLIHRPKHLGGMGFPSMMWECAARTSATLVQTLNDQHRLGTIIRAVTNTQTKIIAGASNNDAELVTKYCTQIRQAQWIARAKMKLTTSSGGTTQELLSATKHPIVDEIQQWTETMYTDKYYNVPLEIYSKLLPLGINTLLDLLEPGTDKLTIISTDGLVKKYGDSVKKIHKIALNNLAKLLHEDPDMLGAFRHTSSAKPYPADMRTVTNNTLCTELTNKRDNNKTEETILEWIREVNTTIQAQERQTRDDKDTQPQEDKKDPQEHTNIETDRKTKRRRGASWSKRYDTLYKNTIRSAAQTKEGKKSRKNNKTNNSLPDQIADQFAVQTILYIRDVNLGTQAKTKNVTFQVTPADRAAGVDATKVHQRQALVRWTNTYVEAHQLQQVLNWHKQKGYKPAKKYYAQKTSHIRMPNKRAPTGQPLYVTNEQEVVMNNAKPILHTAKGQPYDGPFKTMDDIQRLKFISGSRAVYCIKWEYQMEPWANIENKAGFQTAYQNYLNKLGLVPQPRPTLDAAVLTDIVRQSGNKVPRLPDPMPPNLRQKIHFHHQEVKPGMDIDPPGTYVMQPLWIQKDNRIIEVFGCYKPTGQLVGTVSKEKTHDLFSRYNAYAAEARVLHNLTVGAFEEEIAKLLIRYNDNYKINGTKLTKMKNHWANSDPIMDFYKYGLGLEQERFASPLNCTLDTYFSIYPQDAVFGAYIDAFKYQYGGALTSNTEYEAYMMARDIRYSLMAAADNRKPYIATHTLPEWMATAYRKYEMPGGMHKLAHIPRRLYKFKTPDHWNGIQTFADTPKWDVDIWLVCNKRGFQELWNEHRAKGAALLLEEQLGGKLEWSWPTKPKYHKPAIKASKAYKKLPPSPPTRLTIPKLTYVPPTTWPIKTFEGLCLYTDGSAIDTQQGGKIIGAGLYDATNDIKKTVNPVGLGPTNTVPRAELAGILAAQLYTNDKELPSHSHVHIFTDSQTSMQQLQSIMVDPHRFRMHKHAQLMQAILETLKANITSKQIQVHVWKVRGHTGLDGNEVADKIAGEAAKKCMKGETDHDFVLEVGNNPYNELVWLMYPLQTEDKDTQWRHVNNLQQGIRDHIDDNVTYGRSNSGIYATAWEKITPFIFQPAMKTMWDGTLPARVIRQVLKIRGGHVHTQKQAFWYGWAPTPACPLCGQDDSHTHLLTKCPALKGHHIERHNKLARLTVRSIMNGDKGRYVIWADIGKATKMGKIGIRKGKELPKWLLPDQARARVKELLPDTDERKRLENYNPTPDYIFLEGITDEEYKYLTQIKGNLNRPTPKMREIQGKAKLHILEVGCCMDTRIETARLEKLQQHKALEQTLRECGWTTSTETFIYGVTGVIHNETHEALVRLGVPRPAAKKVLCEAARLLAKSAHSIVLARRQLERDK